MYSAFLLRAARTREESQTSNFEMQRSRSPYSALELKVTAAAKVDERHAKLTARRVRPRRAGVGFRCARALLLLPQSVPPSPSALEPSQPAAAFLPFSPILL